MNVGDILENSCFKLHLESDTKQGIIEEMVGLLDKAGKLPDRQAALDCVMHRERQMSTGMQYGVAFPHGKTSALQEMVAAFALKRGGVDFASLDGQPSSIFVMTISPITEPTSHVAFLGEVGLLLDDPSVRKRVLEASSREAIIGVLLES